MLVNVHVHNPASVYICLSNKIERVVSRETALHIFAIVCVPAKLFLVNVVCKALFLLIANVGVDASTYTLLEHAKDVFFFVLGFFVCLSCALFGFVIDAGFRRGCEYSCLVEHRKVALDNKSLPEQ